MIPPPRPLPLRLLAALTIVVACSDSGPNPRTMRLNGIVPAGGEGVYLNEDLEFSFSVAVDPFSVNRESLRVVARETGEVARGEWIVKDRLVVFQPAPVLSKDLSDGGYRPATAYRVEILGFPHLNALRGVDGEVFERTVAWEFETVAVGEGFVFADASPEMGQQLLPFVEEPDARPQALHIRRNAPLLLQCAEPLDPATLHDHEFWIDGDEQVPVQLRLLDNRDEDAAGHRDQRAILEVMPVQVLRKRHYTLVADRDHRLRDFHGNRVWTGRPIVFEVEDVELRPSNEFRLEFLPEDEPRFTPVAVPWADGTAYWSDTGVVTVRYPAAAGSGRDGRVELVGREERADIHATRLSVAEGESCVLVPGSGPLILRSQGRLHIAGDLVREAVAPGLARRSFAVPPDVVTTATVFPFDVVRWARSLIERDHPIDFLPGEDLTGFLERAVSEDRDWTILIAGGDLVIDGLVEVSTPLLLVAGGRIRIPEGEVDSRSGVDTPIYLLREGGSLDLDARASKADLIMDPPTVNPLQETLRYAVLSSPIPQSGERFTWTSAEYGGRAGAGEFSVFYLPAEGEPGPDLPVGHPGLVDGGGPVRVLIELSVSPGEVWDPPSLDHVHLAWKEGR